MPVRLAVNGERLGERTPDDVATVEFRSVGLRPGENEVVVECGNFSEKWRLVREL